MKQTLRPYQKKSVEEIRQALARYRSVLYALPTGAGKTTVIADIIEKAQIKGSRVVILAHRAELIDQIIERLKQFHIKTGRIQGSKSKSLFERIQVATVQTLANRVGRNKIYRDFNLIIIDEAHRAAAESYVKIIERIPNAKIIGFTATPYRTDSKSLKDVFQTLIAGVSVSELIQQGHLVSTVVYTSEVKDLDQVHLKGDDYDPSELYDAYNKSEIYDGVVNKYLKHSNGTAICFCINVAHAEQTADAFLRAGVPAAYVHASMPQDARQIILTDFRTGKIKVLCNVFILTEGYDLPKIDTVILNRATRSRIAWRQMIGRGLRPFQGKKVCTVIDMGNNTSFHGFIEQDDEVTTELKGKSQQERQLKIEAKRTKQCPGCFAEVAAALLVCSFCDYDFPQQERGVNLVNEVEFQAFTYEQEKKRRSEIWEAIPTEKLIDYAKANRKADGTKYSLIWVCHQIERRGLVSFDRLEDGRIDLKGKPVKYWFSYAVKIENEIKNGKIAV